MLLTKPLNIIQSVWIGDHLSEMERLTIQSHLRQGHYFHLYVYGEVKNVPNGTKLCDGRDILPANMIFSYQTEASKGSYSAFSNYFRYKLLLDRGNWWCDMDVICLKAFNFDSEYIFASEKQPDGRVVTASCVIKTPPGAEIMKYCWSEAQKHDPKTLTWGTIGPKLLDEGVLFHGFMDQIQPYNVFCPFHWYDAALDPPGPPSLDLSCSHTVHLWQEFWRRQGLDKDREYPGTLYGNLKNALLYP